MDVARSAHQARDAWGLRRGAVVALLAFALPALGEAAGPPGGACPAHLFVIARSKNANIVVYDANRGPSGDFVASAPVVAYWLLNGENGKREELNRIQRERAYGFDISRGDAPGTYVLAFKAAPQRRFAIRMLDRCPVATGPIGAQSGILRRIFVQSKEESVMPRVEYVEIFGGNDAGPALYEKFVPGE
jgi:uncharacterized protein DUF4833